MPRQDKAGNIVSKVVWNTYFSVPLHLGCAVPKLRLVVRQFLVVLLQATTLYGHMAILLLETDYFGF